MSGRQRHDADIKVEYREECQKDQAGLCRLLKIPFEGSPVFLPDPAALVADHLVCRIIKGGRRCADRKDRNTCEKPHNVQKNCVNRRVYR